MTITETLMLVEKTKDTIFNDLMASGKCVFEVDENGNLNHNLVISYNDLVNIIYKN